MSKPKIPEDTLCECTDLRCCKSRCYNPATELVYDGPGKHAWVLGAALCVKCASWGERGS